MQERQLNKRDPQNFSRVGQEQFHLLTGLEVVGKKKKKRKTKTKIVMSESTALISIAQSWAEALPRNLWWKSHKAVFSKSMLNFFSLNEQFRGVPGIQHAAAFFISLEDLRPVTFQPFALLVTKHLPDWCWQKSLYSDRHIKRDGCKVCLCSGKKCLLIQKECDGHLQRLFPFSQWGV